MLWIAFFVGVVITAVIIAVNQGNNNKGENT